MFNDNRQLIRSAAVDPEQTLGRLVHNAYRLELKGESLRKQRKHLTDNEATHT